MQAADLDLINSVSEPSLHPDGSWAVVAVTRADLDADAYVGQLWRVDLDQRPDGGRLVRRLTRGFRDTDPRFSPDGALIAFLRGAPGKPAQLHVVDAAGGEPVPVTDRRLGVSEFDWSPDGRRLAFVSREPEQGRYGTVDGLDAGAEPPRRITTFSYSQNGLGYDIDRRAHVFLVDVPDVYGEPVVQPAPTPDGPAEPRPVVPAPIKISDADSDHHGIRFSPDGRSLAVITAVHPQRDTDRRTDVLIFPVDEESIGRLAEGPAEDRDGRAEASRLQPINATGPYGPYGVGSLGWSADGRLYLLATDLGPDGRDFVGRNSALYLIDQISAAPRRLTDPAQHDLGDTCATIVPRADGSVLVTEGRRGTHQLVRVDPDGVITDLTEGPVDVSGFDAGADGPVVVSYGHPISFGDLAVVEPDRRLRDLTDFSAAVRGRGLVTPTELTVPGRGGTATRCTAGWPCLPARDRSRCC